MANSFVERELPVQVVYLVHRTITGRAEASIAKSAATSAESASTALHKKGAGANGAEPRPMLPIQLDV
jgi:hypothetical protein